MRAFLVLLLAALVAAPVVGAQGETPPSNDTAATSDTATNDTPTAPAEPIDIFLEGHGVNGQFYFTLKGESAKNPTLVVQPGQQVTVHLTTLSGAVHNFCQSVDGKCTAFASEGGDEVTLTFTAPAEGGALEYWCAPHKGNGMKGTIQVGGAATGGSGSAPETFSGSTVDLGTLGYPECAGTMVPTATAERAVGGPTLQDYVDKCHSGGATVSTERAKHVVDYVIPASFVLIALGIAGTLWVGRSYKP